MPLVANATAACSRMRKRAVIVKKITAVNTAAATNLRSKSSVAVSPLYISFYFTARFRMRLHAAIAFAIKTCQEKDVGTSMGWSD